MNIAFYIADTSPSGITRYSSNMSTSLSQLGYNCKIISDTNMGNKSDPLNIVLSPNKELSASMVIKRIFLLKREIDNNEINVIISNGWYHDMIALTASRISRLKPLVFGVVHTRPELWGLNNNWAGKLKRRLIKKVYSTEDITISVSNALTVSLEKNNWMKKTETIYNPIVSKQIKDLSKIRKLSDGQLKLCCMGWINPVKGYDTAIRALYNVRKKVSATLTIIGGINNKEYYMELINLIKSLELEEYVTFVGVLDNPFNILDSMDIFLLPSRSEALPTALVEAMGLGIPVVACNCEFGPQEILQGSKFGALVPIDDWEAISLEIIKLAGNNIEYENRSRLGIERANSFDFQTCAKQYSELITNVLSEK